MNLNLARFSVSRPVAASIISVAIFVMGLFYLKGLPVSLYPDVSFPFVSVTVPMPGSAPSQIEQTIVKPLEKQLASIKGVKRVIGQVRPGVATMVVGFRMDVDKQTALDDVREKVQVVKAEFPKDAKDPIVSTVDIGATPVLIYGIESKESPEATKKILEDGLVRDLQKTEGVNEAMVVGLGDEQVEITLDPDQLSALRIAPLDVFQQLSTNVATIPWGDARQEGNLLSVTRGTLPQDPAYWDDYTVALADGRTVRLGEIGKAHSVRDDEAALVRINGKPGLGLVITKRAEANTLDTVKKVEATIAARSNADSIKLFPIIDQSTYIEANAHEVWIALFLGGAFAVLVILLFLTDVKSALITATALPVSVAGTFIVMHYLGFSINMMSLLALALAIGLLIDDAVVVREAIFSEIEHGKTAREAAVSGTDKVATAVIATSLAVVAVFVPVSAMEGMVGQFFKEFGLTIVAAVVFSTWVAFTLDPMLSAKFGGEHKPLAGRFWDSWRAFLDRLENGARHLSEIAYRKPWPIIAGSVALLIVSTGLLLSRGADFLAFEDRGQLVVNLLAPPGVTTSTTLALADEAYDRLKGLDGLKDIYASVGGKDKTRAEMRLVFTDKTERDKGLLALAAEANEKLKGIKGEFLVLDPPPVEGVGAEAPLAIYVYGENFDQLFAESEKLVDRLGKIPGIARVRLETSRFSPSVDIQLDPGEMGYWSTNANAIELTGRLALTGLEAGSVGEENLPLFVRYENGKRTLDYLWQDTYVPTKQGPVLLGTLAKSKEGTNPSRIDRERRSRKVIIYGTMDRTRSYAKVLKDIEAELKLIPAPLSAEVAGDKELFEEMTSNFTIAIIGSAFFIFIILAIQFENLLRPFVILLTLPLAAIGAFLALFVVGEKLALGALIGIILLIGLAAKNGILLVDAIGVKERQVPLFDAVTASVRERFRPILMTSVAMIFGMIPTAVMRGSGSEFRAPMAIAIIGGVISSTLLSIVIVPAIFGLIGRMRDRKAKKLGDTSAVRSVPGAKRASALTLTLTGALVAPFLPSPTARAEDLLDAPRADMSQVVALVRGAPKEGSKEGYNIEAMRSLAEELTASSRLAFLGGLRLEAGREWTRPGHTQKVTLPLPPQLGGPQTSELVIVPKEQTTYTVGWALPIFNMQAIEGLEVADLTRTQANLITTLQQEAAAQARAQIVLQYEMAQKIITVAKKRAEIAESRLSIVSQRLAAGVARPSQREEAEASLESAKADLEQAEARLVEYRARFEQQSGLPLPDEGLGIPDFPVMLDRPLNANAIKALEGIEKVHEARIDVIDAGFYPTVDLTVAHQRKDYEPDPPAPQNIVGVKLTWNLLDAGSRRRNTADAMQSLYQAKAETAGTKAQLVASYKSLKARYEGARHGLDARRAAYRAATKAATDALTAYQSGAAQLIDVRTADDAQLQAMLGVFQAQIELQGLAVESLVLTGSLLDYLANPNPQS